MKGKLSGGGLFFNSRETPPLQNQIVRIIIGVQPTMIGTSLFKK